MNDSAKEQLITAEGADVARGSHEHRSGFVALIGPANAGKSTLLNAIVGQKVSIVSPKEQTTRTRILGIKSTEQAQIVFLDTPGFMAKRYRGELSRFISRSLSETAGEGDIVLLVIDALQLKRDQGLPGRLLSSLKERGIRPPRVIAINKIDRLPRPELLPLLDRLNKELLPPLKESLGELPEVVPISALKGDGVQQLEQLLVSLLPEGPAYFPEDEVSDQPEQHLAAEVVREKLFLKLHEELPYSLAVQIERWQETETLLHISAVIFVERPSQKAIVIGDQGRMLKEIGKAARQELEQIFGIHIFLELFVKVEPNWTKTAQGLRKAGYATK